MPLRLPKPYHQARVPFSTAARVYPPLPAMFAAGHTLAPMAEHSATKLGPIARWYLPTCALIALGFGIANALEKHNTRHMNTRERDGYLTERNQALLDAYGERMSLHDVERALEIYEVL